MQSGCDLFHNEPVNAVSLFRIRFELNFSNETDSKRIELIENSALLPTPSHEIIIKYAYSVQLDVVARENPLIANGLVQMVHEPTAPPPIGIRRLLHDRNFLSVRES